MITLGVDLGERSYPIYIGENLLHVAGIEAAGEKSVAAWGYGMAVPRCEPR